MAADGPAASSRPRPSDASVSAVGLDHPVDQADGERLVGATWRPREDQVLGPSRADQPGQPLGAAAARDDAEEDLGLAELGLGRGDAEVAGQRQLAAAAEGEAGDGRDGGPGDGGHGVERIEEQPADERASSGPPNSVMSAPAAKIRSPPVTTTAPGRSVVQRIDRAPELAEHLGRDGVDLGVLEAEDGDAVVAGARR